MHLRNFKRTDSGEIIDFGSIKFSYYSRTALQGKNLLSLRIAILKTIVAISNDPVIFQHSNIALLVCIDKMK